MKKLLLAIFTLTAVSFHVTAQKTFDVSSINPQLEGFPNIRIAEYSNNALFLGGNIAFLNGEVVNPIIRITESGLLDQDFNFQIPYGVNLLDTNML